MSEKSQNVQEKVFTALRWSAGATLVAQTTTWIITIVVIRILTPEDYGLIAIATIFVSFLSVLGEFGLGSVIIHRDIKDLQALRQLLGLVLIIFFLYFLSLYLLAPYIADFFSDQRLLSIIQLLSFKFLIEGFSVIPRAQLTKKLDFKRQSKLNVFAAIVAGFTTLTLALLGFGVWSLVWFHLIFSLVTTIGFNFYHPFLKLPIFSFRGSRDWLHFGGLVSLERILWQVADKSDVFIIGKLLDEKILGFYSISMNLARMPMEKVNNLTNQVAFPAYAHLKESNEVIRASFLKTIRMTASFAFPVFWGISSVAHIIVPLFLGEKWLSATLPLQLISIAMPLMMISSLKSPLLLAMGRPDINIFNLMISLMIMPFSFFLGSQWGISGVCLTWVTVYPIVFFLTQIKMLRLIKVTLLEFSSAFMRPLISGFIMYISVIAVDFIIVEDTFLIVKMIISISLGVFAFMFSLWIIGKEHFQECTYFVKRLIPVSIPRQKS